MEPVTEDETTQEEFLELSNHVQKFRKRPIEIEAVRWTQYIPMRILIEFTDHLVRLDDVEQKFYVYNRLHNTWVKFEYGDWIIKGVKGEFYPCASDVFAATYEYPIQEGEDSNG